MTKISIYKSRFGTSPIGSTTIEDYLTNIKTGTWQDFVLAVRNGKKKKDTAQGVTVSALFDSNRRADNVKSHSGFLAIDIDDQDNDGLVSIRESLQSDPYCYSCHNSIRGVGLVWYVKVDPNRHRDAFFAIEKYLANQYGICIDSSGKDISRFRFVSYDPFLYLNEKSKKWNKYIPKKDKPVLPPTINAFHDDDISHIMDQISRGVNIAEDYDSWLKTSFALADKFGESGRSYFHAVSAQSSKYDAKKCDKQYETALRRKSSGITIGTFFHYCSQAGIEIKTPITKEVEMVAKQRLKSSRNKGDAIAATKDYFKTMRGLSGERVDGIIKKISEVSVSDLKKEKIDDKTKEMELFISQFKLRHNTISRVIEIDKNPITDRDINSIYLKAMHAIDHNVSKPKLWDMIDSELVPNFDPFRDFFKRNQNMKPTGVIKELRDCFTIEQPDLSLSELTEDEIIADYLEVFLTRWLVGIVSAMHGTYSLLVLVLTGGQGTGKSKFFRGLLPDELQPYYAESKLDRDKDDGILMCQKLILMDDEFSGKNKKEATRFKEISSRQTFTVRRPYGKVFEDLPRIAVLCGTSNEDEILNDVTGNRRLIPVNVKSIDIERFEAIDKTELFMELYHTWKDIGDGWMLGKKEIAYLNKSTTSNEQVSFEAEMIQKFFEPSDSEGGNTSLLTCSEIKNKIDNRTNERVNVFKLGQTLKKLGFKQKHKKYGKTTKRVYLCIDNYKETKSEPSVDF